MKWLLDHWGVEMVKDRVAGDRRYARMVNAGEDKRVVPAPFLTWMSVRGESFSQSDVVTSQISLLNLQSAGILQQKEGRSEEHTSELQSLMRISYAVFCLKKKSNHVI